MSDRVTERLFTEPCDTVENVRGIALVHPVGDTICETPWAASVCRCGYYTLTWAITPADLAAMRPETPV